LNYGHNPSYLTSVSIDKNKVFPTTDFAEALATAQLIVFVIPAAFMSGVLELIDPSLMRGKWVVSSVKGMIPEENILVSDLIGKKFDLPQKRLAVIGGPCHAEEVAMEKKSYLTIASQSTKLRRLVADQLSCRFIQTNTSADIYGIEYCAVMKNIIAISCGIARGLNYGDNFQAVLVSNAIQEIKRFLKAAYHLKRNLSESAYLGDLLVTAYSQFSRNRSFGYMLGRGYTVKSAQIEMNMIAEGHYAVKSIYQINEGLGVNMPITAAVYRIVYEKISPIIEFRLLEEQIS
jgi:glycerol-3-phosphate dehydrogenase (NAD(P)+)